MILRVGFELFGIPSGAYQTWAVYRDLNPRAQLQGRPTVQQRNVSGKWQGWKHDDNRAGA